MALAIWKIAYPLRLACSAKAATTRRTVTGRLSSFTALRLPSLTAAEAEQSLDGAGGKNVSIGAVVFEATICQV